MRRVVAALAVSAVVLVPAAPAPAVPLSQFLTYSGSSFDAEQATPFDTSLGTLDSVDVFIRGRLSTSGVTATNFTGGPVPIPLPYSFSVEVSQRFFGLLDKYFEFFEPARFVFNGAASGTGEPFAFVTDYTYEFDFDAASDLTGFTLASVSSSSGTLFPPLTGIGGLRADFLPALPPIDEIHMMQTASATAVGAPPPVVTNFSTDAVMEIRYNYTPVTAAAPAPGSGLLLVLAGSVAIWVRKRREKDSRRMKAEG
jgi:hypothetical protein